MPIAGDIVLFRFSDNEYVRESEQWRPGRVILVTDTRCKVMYPSKTDRLQISMSKFVERSHRDVVIIVSENNPDLNSNEYFNKIIASHELSSYQAGSSNHRMLPTCEAHSKNHDFTNLALILLLSVALFLSAMTKNAAYVMQEPRSNLALICEAREINMNRFLTFFGSNSIAGAPRFIDAIYPNTLSWYLY